MPLLFGTIEIVSFPLVPSTSIRPVPLLNDNVAPPNDEVTVLGPAGVRNNRFETAKFPKLKPAIAICVIS